MKKLLPFVFVAITGCSTVDQNIVPTPESDITKARLTGSWQCNSASYIEDARLTFNIVTEYREDNTFKGSGTVTARFRRDNTYISFALDANGSWGLNGRILTDQTEDVTVKALNAISVRIQPEFQEEMDKMRDEPSSSVVIYVDDQKLVTEDRRKERSSCVKIKA
ncbi:hypothetical protein [Spongorhabdus nitratireducens]